MLSVTALFSADEAVVYGAVRDAYGRVFTPRAGIAPLLRNLLLLTAASLLPLLLIFLLRRPAALQSGMWAQVALHGLPVVLLVNLAMARFYAAFLPKLLSGRQWQHLLLLLGDAVARLILTASLTALSFLLWALLRGSFAGSASSALGAVAVSFQYGIRLESLTGVYLYAVGLGALPLFTLAFLPLLSSSTTVRWVVATFAYLLPVIRLPAVATMLCFCLASVAILTTAHALLDMLQGLA